MQIEDENVLKKLLEKRCEIDRQIKEHVLRACPDFRFSLKKFVADLGEYYFKQNVSIFKSLTQSPKSNEAYDFLGVISDKQRSKWELDSTTVKIEIKTRYAQTGNNYLAGIKPGKFDLLGFVALDENYGCRYIGLIRARDLVLPDGANRILFTNYSKNGSVIWQTCQWEELPKLKRSMLEA